MIVKMGTGRAVHSQLQDKLRVLRLFKEGNVVMPYSCLYRGRPGGRAQISGPVRSYPIWDRTPFVLELDELEEARGFVAAYSLPLSRDYLQLAFEGFELSYEVHDPGLAFLSLMIAMEVLLGPKDHYGEMTHRIARNTAVLLGRDREDGERVFKDVKNLYRKRPKIVHEGKRAAIAHQDTLRLRSYVREALKEAMRIGVAKEEALTILNGCGFGERPSREGG